MSAVLAIDLGNSDTKFGLVEFSSTGEACLRGVARIPTPALGGIRSGKDLVSSIPDLAPLVADRPPVALGSVVSRAGAVAAALLTNLGCAVRPIVSLDFADVPFPSLGGRGFRIDYEHGEPGVDRVAACAEAFARSGGPLIVVGAGTALHTNAVTGGGIYRGGAIMPGMRLMSEALGGGTDHVRPVAPRQPDRVLGRSTPECAEIGIYYAWLGGALALVERSRTELGGEAHVWLTGGHATWLQPHLPGSEVDAHLALFGLARAYMATGG